MKRQNRYLAIAAGLVWGVALMTLTGCKEEITSLSDLKKNEYTVSWIKKFGLVDGGQTWNVAVPVKADVDPSAYGRDVCVYIYTANPTNGGKLIGKASSRTTLTLDVMRGEDKVFVQVLDAERHCYENSYYNIKDGAVSVCGRRSLSRSISDVSLGDTKVFAEGANRQEEREAYNPVNPYTLTEAIAKGDKKYLWKKSLVIDHGEWETFYTVTFEDIYGNEYSSEFQWYFNFNDDEFAGFTAYGGFTDEEIASMGSVGGISQDMNKRLLHPASHEVTYQKINGVETTHDKTVKVKDLAPLFGRDSYFEEQSTPSCLEKWKDHFNPDVEFTVSGPLTLDFMYGATQNRNIFGYYYWQEGEDPTEAVRYILIDNATPDHNISINTADNYISGGMALSGIMLDGNPEESEDMIIGTSYKVPYFDAEGNPSYDFPNGTHVAFFLIVNGMTNEDGWLGNTNLSVQSHNYEIGRTFSGYSRENADPDASKGEIDAISFQYGNQFYLGFEDRGGDKDMNDIVFFVNGNAKPKEPYIKIDTGEPGGDEPGGGEPGGGEPGGGDDPDPGVTVDANAWIVACEDLGSVDDYDFNDVVFAISHVAGETTAEITPLAAGGIYNASILYDGAPINGTVANSEIHYLFTGQHYTDRCPVINTNAGQRFVPGQKVVINVPADFSIATDLGKFSIQVEGRDESYHITIPDDGTAPQILCLPGNWKWPYERVDIMDAYPSFKTWNENMEALGWLNNVTQGSVYPR